jgi:hypothetical protein
LWASQHSANRLHNPPRNPSFSAIKSPFSASNSFTRSSIHGIATRAMAMNRKFAANRARVSSSKSPGCLLNLADDRGASVGRHREGLKAALVVLGEPRARVGGVADGSEFVEVYDCALG